MPGPAHGEKVIAFVALRDGLTASEPELRDFVRARIADYKIPERIVCKVQRRDLKDMLLAFEQWS